MNLLDQMGEAASRFGNRDETSVLGDLIRSWICEYEREVNEASRRMNHNLDEISQLEDELDDAQRQSKDLELSNDRLRAENEKLKLEIVDVNNKLEGFIARTVGCVRVL